MPPKAQGRSFLSPHEIETWPTRPRKSLDDEPRQLLQQALIDNDLWRADQVAGRNFAMGCVSLEITQRCNLDCSLCYLSDMAEAVHDLPLDEVFRRIDMIHDYFGLGTDVQVSGGDPTLRNPNELIAIVARIAERGMRPSLFTNGIRATRSLLKRLASAGLADVAFHVDLTQARKGYKSENALNELRLRYIKNAESLGLRIMFNTTVFDGNVREMPDLVRFFVKHAREIQLASFQLHADTGRGVLRSRDKMVSQDQMMRDIKIGTGLDLDFEMPRIGHPSCNKYTGILASGDDRVPLFDDGRLFAELFAAEAPYQQLWHRHRALAILTIATRHPILAAKMAAWSIRKAWALRRGLLRTGRVTKLSFFIHNFMNADQLERDRCESCVFMVATRDGPLSMCVHNAIRDHYVLAPIRLGDDRVWHPLSGETYHSSDPQTLEVPEAKPQSLPMKKLRGRWRAGRAVDRARLSEPTCPRR